MISRAELDELYREDDRLRAEHREWVARREAQAQALVQRNSGEAGLVLETTDNALLSAPEPQSEAFDEADEMPFSDDQNDVLALVIHELRREWEQAHAVQIAELRGQISALLAIVGKSLPTNSPEVKSADTVDLPNFIRQRDAA